MYLREHLTDYQLLEGDLLWRAAGRTRSTRKCFDERLPDSGHISAGLYQTHHTAYVAVSMTSTGVSYWLLLLLPTPLSCTYVRGFSHIAETTTTIGLQIRFLAALVLYAASRAGPIVMFEMCGWTMSGLKHLGHGTEASKRAYQICSPSYSCPPLCFH